ncbi:BNR repeat domain protein [Labilithrix luteola]|uniref:BNR repeat domain protein n=1 Tax=Labilithrix luteola TaxID=1391654 RepID=A0A0K1PZJ2_9BACT|nr:hypothetical protein [Labilithrix luteola]AKU98796.1 BNR repeat domain protein [Labilithrix luteola]
MDQRVFRGCLLALATGTGVALLGACESDPSNADGSAGQTTVVREEEDASSNVDEPDAARPDAARPDAARPDAAEVDASKDSGDATTPEPCEAGTWDDDGNAATECASCEAGTYCAGGEAAKVPCAEGTWDHDGTAATACTPWADCGLGSFVEATGTAVANRKCTTCPIGQTSTTTNAQSCEDVPPVPGGPCSTVGETFARSCGNCGTQAATCDADNVVSEFGSCSEPAGACAPGTNEAPTACGYCGTTSRTCNDQCTWVAQPCVGESIAVDRCMAGEKQDRTEGCQDDVTRAWTCGATCAWEPPAMTCETASRIVTVGTAVGTTTSRRVTQNSDKIKRLTASSVPCSLSTQTDTHYVYVEIRNPNATAAKIEVGASAATGQVTPDVLIAAYSTLPSDTDARKACLSGAEISCSGNSATYSACLTGTKTPAIPAKGSIWVYVGNYRAGDEPLTFDLKTKITAL